VVQLSIQTLCRAMLVGRKKACCSTVVNHPAIGSLLIILQTWEALTQSRMNALSSGIYRIVSGRDGREVMRPARQKAYGFFHFMCLTYHSSMFEGSVTSISEKAIVTTITR
jgi:hypothetical protein